jgi:hypothetical protein
MLTYRGNPKICVADESQRKKVLNEAQREHVPASGRKIKKGMEQLCICYYTPCHPLEVFVRLRNYFIRITVNLSIIRTVNQITDTFSCAT